MLDEDERAASIAAYKAQKDVAFAKSVVLWLAVVAGWGFLLSWQGAYSYFAIVVTLNLFTGARLGVGFAEFRFWVQTVLHVFALTLSSLIVVILARPG